VPGKHWTPDRAARSAAVLVLFLAACAGPPQNLPGTWDIGLPAADEATYSRRVVLVADNQLHNLFADPVPLRRSAAADRLVPVAIRPTQLDFFGSELLEWALDRTSKTPAVHLGDGCNLACVGEFVRFVWHMRRARAGWVMAPGNHDGYFFGNEHADESGTAWQAACRHITPPLLKDRFVRLYVAALLLQRNVVPPSFRLELGLDPEPPPEPTWSELEGRLRGLGARLPPALSWRKTGSERGLLSAIAWRIDSERPWRSFVVQEIDLSEDFPARGLLLDTCQYRSAPSLIPLGFLGVNSGLNGEILEDQAEAAEGWTGREPGAAWALMGHHPYDALTSRGRRAVDGLRARAGGGVFVSAHTHAGSYRLHGSGEATWIELNVGSILDWPIERRSLQFARARGHLWVRAPREDLGPVVQEEFLSEGFPPDWEARPEEPDFFLRYAHLTTTSTRATEMVLRDGLLAAWRRMLEHVPTLPEAPPGDREPTKWPAGTGSDREVRARIERTMGEGVSIETKVGLLVELEEFDRTRTRDEAAARKYRLVQAWWASKYEALTGRRPAQDDWTVAFPER